MKKKMLHLNIKRLSFKEFLPLAGDFLIAQNGPTFNWDQEKINSLMESPTLQFYVGYCSPNENIVSLVGLLPLSPPIYEILFLASHPLEKRKGFMKETLKLLIGTVGHNSEYWLEVAESNKAAQNLYEQIGFQRLGLRKKYYSDGSNAWLYSWRSKEST